MKLEMTENLLVEHAEAIRKVLRRAIRHALLDHKRAGNPVATWQDGKVVILRPEEIPIDENNLEEED